MDTLQGAGPFTVFAPTNAAFAKLPAGTVDMLLKPESKPALTKVLTYHVVAGKLDAEALMSKVRAGKGSAELTTVSGGKLWVVANGPKNLVLKDEKGMTSEISTYDVFQSNGVIHVVTSVLDAEVRAVGRPQKRSSVRRVHQVRRVRRNELTLVSFFFGKRMMAGAS